MRKLILSMMVASTAFAAVPASAQAWRIQPGAQRQIQTDINQLENRIQRAAQKRTITQREATGLRREALALQRLHNRYARNGLDRNEVGQLETQVNRLHQQLRLERRDWDRRRG
jgi:HAMP domain-containing protein